MAARAKAEHLPTCPARLIAGLKCIEGKWCPGHEPSVVNGRLMRCSPSQVSTFRQCQAKWTYDKVIHLPRKPEGKGQIIGGEGHEQIEHWAKTGEDVRSDLARISDPYLKPFLRLMPFNVRAHVSEWTRPLPLINGVLDPVAYQAAIEADVQRNALSAEELIPKLVTPGGVEIVGYTDMMIPPGHDLILTGFDKVNVQIGDGLTFDARPYPVIVDHKFRGDMKWASTPGELELDEQAIIYGRAALERWPGVECVVFRHHNHQYKGRRIGSAITCILGADHIRAQWDVICTLIDVDMQRVAAAGLLGAAFNEGACGSFGGCDYEATCSHSPGNRFLAFVRPSGAPAQVIPKEANTPMASLTDMLASALGPAAGAPAPAAPVPPPAGLPAPAGGPAPTAAPYVPPAAPPAPAAPAPAPAAPAAANVSYVLVSACVVGNLYGMNDGPVCKCEGLMATGGFFTNAQAVPRMVPFANADGSPAMVRDATSDPVSRATFKLPPLGGITPPDMPAHSPLPAPAAAAPIPPGLVNVPPGATVTMTPGGNPIINMPAPGAPLPAPAAAPAGAPAPAPAPTPAPTEKAKRGRKKKGTEGEQSTGPSDEGLTLLIDCNAEGARDLSAFVLETAQKVAAAGKVFDVRLAPQDHALAFGRWKAMVAQTALQESITGLCSIRSGELADPIIEALAGVADLVVRR